MLDWFQTPIAPWWALLFVRAFSAFMAVIALERALGAVVEVVRPGLSVLGALWEPDGRRLRWRERIALARSLLRVQAEIAPPATLGLSLGRAAVIALGSVALLLGLTAQLAWSTLDEDPPLTPAMLSLNAGLSLLCGAISWQSRPAHVVNLERRHVPRAEPQPIKETP